MEEEGGKKEGGERVSLSRDNNPLGGIWVESLMP